MKNLKKLFTILFLLFSGFAEAATFTLKGASSAAAVPSIPTLSEWGIIILSLLLIYFGTYKIINKRKMGFPLLLFGFVMLLTPVLI